MQTKSVKEKEMDLENVGYLIVATSEATEISDPLDDAQGFSLTGNNHDSIINEAWKHIFTGV